MLKQKIAFLATIIVLAIVSTRQVQAVTTEDDGWVTGDYQGTPDEQKKQAQQDWEDAGKPGQRAEVPTVIVLPDCKNGVVQDCQVPGGITCIVSERDDPCMDIWYGNTGGGWPECCTGEKNEK